MPQRFSRTPVIFFLAYAVVLVAWAYLAPVNDVVIATLSAARFEGVSWLALWNLLGAVGGIVLKYLPLGALAAWMFSRSRQSWFVGVGDWILAMLCSCVGAWVIRSIEIGADRGGAGLTDLILPGVGLVLGVGLGFSTRRGASGIRNWLLRWLGVFVAFLLLSVGIYRGAQADERILGVPAKITSAEKRALVNTVRQHNPLKLGVGETTELRFGIDQLRAILAWGAQIADPDALVQLSNQGNAIQFAASITLTNGRYLNIQGRTQAVALGASLRVGECSLQVGSLALHGAACRVPLQLLYRMAAGDNNVGPVLSAIDTLRLDQDGFQARYGRVQVASDMRSALQGLLGPGPNVRRAVEAQFEHLAVLIPQVRAAADPLAEVMSESFQLANSRSARGDPSEENQAAILVLGTLFGHHDVATLAGIQRPADFEAIRSAYGPLELRSRSDWTRHFLVSAAITQISTVALSDAAGLLKEELDATAGGFSFSDLLADRAGTRFGEAATRDEATARALQLRVIGRRWDQIMPDGKDLPEGVSDVRLQSQYGGVGGALFNKVAADIELRLDTCCLY